MKCKEVIEFLMDYLDGGLAQQVRADFERHMACCSDCVEFLESYKATIQLGRNACEACEENAPPIPEGLVRAILKARGEQGKG